MISFAFDVDAYQKNMSEMKKDLKKEGFINSEKKQEKKDVIMTNETKEENDKLEQNNSAFKNANLEEDVIDKEIYLSFFVFYFTH